ncbi:MAG TPA: glycosyltransferase family 39 protein [Ferruginibacter sp.]|nr:glycosyltransferase family 39 protein [Ferruginibacter sp.]
MKKNTTILLVFIITKFALHYFLIHPEYDLQRDEYLHLDQGNHLAWGYISVPPVTSWIAYLIKLLGNGVFWVKFFPAAFGAVTMILIWKMIKELKGGLYALILGMFAILLSVILRINILFQPNSLDILFWTLVYYTIIKYINSNNSKWLIAAALAAGFGFLSKYNIIFLVLGLVPAILLTKLRKIFQDKMLYAGIAIALVIVLPNLLWQYRNDWPTLHQLKELSDTQLVNVKRTDFIKEQFLFFTGPAFIIIGAFIGLLFYQPFGKYRFVLWSYLITILIFIFLKAKPYYAIGLYPVLMAFGSVYMEKITVESRKRYWRVAMVVVLIGLSIPFILIAFPIKSPAEIQQKNKRYKSLGLLRWEDGKDHELPQDFADMTGWKELATKVDSIYLTLENKPGTLVICDNYGQAGAINYYSEFKNIHAVSYNADYINWIELDKKITNVILVKDVYDDDSTRLKEQPLFDTILLTGEIENPYSREKGTKIFLLKKAKTDINRIIANDIKERRSQ